MTWQPPDPKVLSRINVADVYPPLMALVMKLLENCEARGIRYYAISGLRSHAEQNALYAQGRTAPGKVVTKAKGGESFHNFGLAVDFCRDKDMTRAGLQPDWDKASYAMLAEEAQKLGLEAGLYWKFVDAPHIQLKIAAHGIDLRKLQTHYATGGLPGVWKFLDGYSWPQLPTI
jgi:peptidoglycan LD-endopeptidase CwlK